MLVKMKMMSGKEPIVVYVYLHDYDCNNVLRLELVFNEK